MGTRAGRAKAQATGPDRRRLLRREDDRRLQQRDAELGAARRVSEALSQHLGTDELVVKVLETALEVVRAESGSILLADPDTRQLVFRHSVGASPVQPGTAIPWDKGIAGAVFQSGEPIVLGDVAQDRRHWPGVDTLTQHITRDMIALPLKRWEGQPIGVLEILNKVDGSLGEDDMAVLTVVSAVAASSLEQARLYQEAKLAEVVRLLGDISHDIKNLLMPVFTGAELMEAELREMFDGLPELQRRKAGASYQLCKEVIAMFGTSTRRIQDRVKEIADCVKGVSTEPVFAPCDVHAVLQAVFESVSWQMNQKKLSLKIDGLEKLPRIMADERRLFNAFYNLINNAIPEVPSGGAISVYGKEDPPGVGILVAVADTGRGMAADVRDALFTARAWSRKAGGTGLGTKIVKDVVDAHRGRVSVESEEGLGTTFYVFLPLTQPPASSRA